MTPSHIGQIILAIIFTAIGLALFDMIYLIPKNIRNLEQKLKDLRKEYDDA